MDKSTVIAGLSPLCYLAPPRIASAWISAPNSNGLRKPTLSWFSFPSSDPTCCLCGLHPSSEFPCCLFVVFLCLSLIRQFHLVPWFEYYLYVGNSGNYSLSRSVALRVGTLGRCITTTWELVRNAKFPGPFYTVLIRNCGGGPDSVSALWRFCCLFPGVWIWFKGVPQSFPCWELESYYKWGYVLASLGGVQ